LTVLGAIGHLIQPVLTHVAEEHRPAIGKLSAIFKSSSNEMNVISTHKLNKIKPQTNSSTS